MALVTHQNNGKICFHFRMSHDLTIVPIVKRHEVIYENKVCWYQRIFLTNPFLQLRKIQGPIVFATPIVIIGFMKVA